MAPRLLAALGLALALVLCGCTYSREEPGLFRVRSPSPTLPADPEPDSDRTPGRPSARSNPDLPVAGEVLWTTGEGAEIPVRFAVHAVRRITGATVLDYSITPLPGPSFRSGDSLPSLVDFGIDRAAGGDVRIVLIDPRAGHAYRTLTHVSRRQFQHCLCSPLWAAQPEMRVGETRLLQAAFPALAADVGFVDVALANVPPVVHVPVTPVGQVPTARTAVDLTRPPDPPPPHGSAVGFRYPGYQTGRIASIAVDEAIAASGHTALRWTLRSLSGELDYRGQPLGPPLAAPVPDGVEVVNTNPVSGPTLRSARGGPTLAVSWTTVHAQDRPAYECLCSDLGLWARSLDSADGSVQVTALYPPLPRSTREIEVELPGLSTVRLPVTRATDAAAQLGPPVRRETRSWIYSNDVPPQGWSAAEWPTPLPDPWQLVDYRAVVEDIRPLPAS